MKIDDLTNEVATNMGDTKKGAKGAITAVFKALGESLTTDGDNLIIPGFGTFRMKLSTARSGRNPQTGAVIQIPEKLTLKFKPSKLLQDNY